MYTKSFMYDPRKQFFPAKKGYCTVLLIPIYNQSLSSPSVTNRGNLTFWIYIYMWLTIISSAKLASLLDTY